MNELKILLIALNAQYIHSSLALRSLRSYCESESLKQDNEFMIREYTINNDLLAMLSDIYRLKPEVIGIACYIWNMNLILNLASLIKKVLPNGKIVLGGPEVSYDPDTILEKYPAIDYIVMGEGEEAFAALLKVPAGYKEERVPGLCYRRGADVVANGLPNIIPDLNSLPFPYVTTDIYDLKDKIIYYESSRGCPFSCQYCLSSITQGVRFLSLERVFNDLEFFIRHDVKQVKFVDRTFNARKDHYFPILKFLANQSCRTNFHFEIAADMWDREVLSFLQTVPPGRFQFEIGIQSTNQSTLCAIQRQNNWERIANNVRCLHKHGNIHLHLDLIVGLPYEDMNKFARSFNDVYSLQPDMLQIGFLKLLKGSGIRREAAKYGYVYMDSAPYEVLANNCLSYDEIRRLKIMEEVFNQVYNSGRFRYSLPWMILKHTGSAFKFYYDLAAYWEERGLHLVSHGVKSLYLYMAQFFEKGHLQDMNLYLEFLKFDALLADKVLVRPEFLPWNQSAQHESDPWEKEKASYWRDADRVSRYVKNYSFTTWRDIKKKYHIEVFNYDIPSYIQERLPGSTTVQQKEVAILFSYAGNSPAFQTIKPEDFW
ncbi:MAG TPA: B12-binding domain-containing radical SAM protein [Methylomusa anaerophila]|nr:B12-binding domain-containing radical SAM protein [Methylomusa anaerophila]HML87531.1 B12-binding domain-containing radical SAM protein [Methylomusa anaerophila]